MEIFGISRFFCWVLWLSDLQLFESSLLTDDMSLKELFKNPCLSEISSFENSSQFIMKRKSKQETTVANIWEGFGIFK